jgi:Protein of unknown function (DUF998)
MMTTTAPTTTRTLLTCGAVAGPLFVGTALIQAATRAGFDLRLHPFSMLALGGPGWIQITNFVVCGLLFIAGAVGMRRVLSSRAAPVLIGLFGASQIAGGAFRTDPGLGFPAGAPLTAPTTLGLEGVLHLAAFAVGMLSLVTACVVFARLFRAAGDRGWARYSGGSGAAFVVLAALGVAGGDFRFTAAAITIGWIWASLVAARLRRRA